MTTTTRYALCSDVTPAYATVRVLADSRDELVYTSDELAEMGLDDTAQVLEVDASAEVGERITH